MRRCPKILVAIAALVTAAAGCGSGTVTESVATGRFTVTMTAEATSRARAAGVDLREVVARALGRINALLPGPPTAIMVGYSQKRFIPQIGTSGYTDPQTGKITIFFGPTPDASAHQVMTFWLPRTLSHEVDHAVRVLAGPGFGTALGEQIVTEGISSVFDQAAFPGPPSPWDAAITPSQECSLWKQAEPVLGQAGLYGPWMFGYPAIPQWTGFTIGYHIIVDYLHHHPHTSWAALTAEHAGPIISGSRYQPCRT